MAIFRSGKPSFRLTLSSDTTLGGTSNEIPWDLAVFQEPVLWSSGSRWQCDRAGLYVLSATVRENARAGAATGNVLLNVTGGVAAAQQMPANAGTKRQSCSTVIHLQTFDEVWVTYSTSAAGCTLAAFETHLEGARIGPVRWT